MKKKLMKNEKTKMSTRMSFLEESQVN